MLTDSAYCTSALLNHLHVNTLITYLQGKTNECTQNNAYDSMFAMHSWTVPTAPASDNKLG